jgi:hypothetical protein
MRGEKTKKPKRHFIPRVVYTDGNKRTGEQREIWKASIGDRYVGIVFNGTRLGRHKAVLYGTMDKSLKEAIVEFNKFTHKRFVKGRDGYILLERSRYSSSYTKIIDCKDIDEPSERMKLISMRYESYKRARRRMRDLVNLRLR